MTQFMAPQRYKAPHKSRHNQFKSHQNRFFRARQGHIPFITKAGRAETVAMLHISSTGRKRRFGAAGLINVMATNILLQSILASHLTSIAIAATISQIFNGILGYGIYSKWVFKSKKVLTWRHQTSYSMLMACNWIINTIGIQMLNSDAIGLSRNWAAAAMIAPLAILSYGVQKSVIFRA
jgi:putative flippase GtrA